ncbi:MAG: DinB family protein [Bacillota bacterium]
MTPIELTADNLQRNLGLLKMTLADFSDGDMLVRPCPGANHALWQLGHLIVSEARMVGACRPEGGPELPANLADKFNAKTAGINDAGAFLPKAKLLEILGDVRAATVKWVGGLKPEDLNRPGPERMKEIAPTVGHMVMLLSGHQLMHLGQMQVIRRKLGKPVLF